MSQVYNLSRYQWQEKPLPTNWQTQVEMLQKAGLKFSPAFLKLCLVRGLTTVEAIEQATTKQPQLFHDPFLLYDMDKAIERLMSAVEIGQQIVVYGDYDADGITSTLILYEALVQLGAEVRYYLPNRLIDGYGPNLARYQQLVADGAELILTCDNGVAGHEAIEWAMSQGVDVIVSDHHELSPTLPPAYAVIHPRHPKGKYPFGELCGAGVALKIATALYDEVPIELVELAAIGTIADMMPLVDENRTIVKNGLQLMKETQRLGLLKLLETANIALEDIDEETIGFTIGPRLNAIGRLGDPTPALHLLQSEDELESEQLVALVEEKNNERKFIVETMMAEVQRKLEALPELPPIIIDSDPNWPAGVLGIVAGRLVEKYHRPVILCQYQTDQQWYKGSGRSIEGVHLFQLLQEQATLLQQFGGHKQAAGLTVSAQQWEHFQQAMLTAMSRYQNIIDQPEQKAVDLSIKIDELTVNFIEELHQLSPFGMENPRPMLRLEASLTGLRTVGITQQHLKFQFSQHDATLDGIGFHLAEQLQGLSTGIEVIVFGEAKINQWKQKTLPQLQVVDIGTQDTIWVDWRSKNKQSSMWHLEQAVYCCQTEQSKMRIQAMLHPSSQVVTYQQLIEAESPKKRLVFVDLPPQIEQLQKWMRQQSLSHVYIVGQTPASRYLVGVPSREEFAKLYRYIQQQETFNIRENLARIEKQLRIPEIKLKTMFRVFFEAKFVTIENGQVMFQGAPETKVVLEKMPGMQQYIQLMEAESVLLYQSLEQIQQYFNEK